VIIRKPFQFAAGYRARMEEDLKKCAEDLAEQCGHEIDALRKAWVEHTPPAVRAFLKVFTDPRERTN